MMKKLVLSSALAAFTAVPLAASAATPIAPVGPTVTVLTATPTLLGAGVGVAALGSGTLTFDASGNAVGLFPITGGYLDPDLSNAQVEHVGSGLRLSRNGVDVDLENFLIDTTLAQDTIFGQVTVGATVLNDVPLFTLSGLNLFLSDSAGAALNSFLGIPNLAGVQLGFALTSPVAAVPEPESYAMMIAGLGAIALMVRRRRQALPI